MSHLTDDARRRGAKTHITVPGQSLEEIVAANPDRRRLLQNGLLGLSILPFAGVLSARSEERRVGTESGSTISSRGSPYHYKTQYTPTYISLIAIHKLF